MISSKRESRRRTGALLSLGAGCVAMQGAIIAGYLVPDLVVGTYNPRVVASGLFLGTACAVVGLVVWLFVFLPVFFWLPPHSLLWRPRNGALVGALTAALMVMSLAIPDLPRLPDPLLLPLACLAGVGGAATGYVGAKFPPNIG